MATVAPIPGGWTYQQYLELDDDQRYEIIEGELLLTPAPGTRHQLIAGKLYIRIAQFAEKHGRGVALHAPTDVVLSEENVVQPDILFVSNQRSAIINERAIHGAPDLAVEVLSPSSIRRDRHRKQALYERAGVREFWLVDPANQTIEVFSLTGAGYELTSFAAERGQVESQVLEGLTIEVSEIFSD